MNFVANSRKPWDRDALSKLAGAWRSPTEAFGDPKLSKLGDALLNLIYSLSLSQARGIADGRKIPNIILAKAIESSKHRDLVPRRSDKHRKGDIVEAIFAYAWLKGILDIRRCAAFLARRHQSKENGLDPDGYSKAMGELLDDVLTEMEIPEHA